MRSLPPRADRRLLVATRSRHKLEELRALLHLPDVDLVSLDDLGIAEEAVEDAATFRGNAIAKARFYAGLAGLPTLADDSGLEVDALGGGPGVRTRRYAGPDATDERNNAKLLNTIGTAVGLTNAAGGPLDDFGDTSFVATGLLDALRA